MSIKKCRLNRKIDEELNSYVPQSSFKKPMYLTKQQSSCLLKEFDPEESIIYKKQNQKEEDEKYTAFLNYNNDETAKEKILMHSNSDNLKRLIFNNEDFEVNYNLLNNSEQKKILNKSKSSAFHVDEFNRKLVTNSPFSLVKNQNRLAQQPKVKHNQFIKKFNTRKNIFTIKSQNKNQILRDS